MRVYFVDRLGGEEFVRDCPAVPSAGDTFDREDGRNYSVVSVHWKDEPIDPSRSERASTMIKRTTPYLIIREMNP